VRLPSVDAEAVGHLDDRQTSEGDHLSVIVAVHTRPGSERRLTSASSLSPAAASATAVTLTRRQLPVELERAALLVGRQGGSAPAISG
jgi:hypothetical protein